MEDYSLLSFVVLEVLMVKCNIDFEKKDCPNLSAMMKLIKFNSSNLKI